MTYEKPQIEAKDDVRGLMTYTNIPGGYNF